MDRPTFRDLKIKWMEHPKFQEEYEKLKGKIVIYKSLNIKVSAEMADKVRDYVYWTPGTTVSSFIEECIKEALKSKGTIEKRKEELKSGRKVK
jgi:hypothetical protein